MAYIGRTPQSGNFQVCDAITTSATATYNLLVDTVAVSPETANHCIVSLNGVIQAPTSAFTISGSTIVFASALTSADVIDFIHILGSVLDLGVPSDNTVSTAKIVDGAITSAKLTYPLTTFSSTGIDDNADATAMTIDSSEKVTMTRPRSNTLGDSALQILPSDTVVGYGFRMESTNNDLVLEKSAPSGSEAEILRFMATGGIALGGTGTANVLDDYEEGTWTPVINSGTYSYLGYAKYTKIGNQCHLHFRIGNFSDTSSATDIQITGMPFAQPSNTETGVGSAYGERSDVNKPTVDINSNIIRFRDGFGVSTFDTPLQYSDINNGADFDIMATVTYETA